MQKFNALYRVIAITILSNAIVLNAMDIVPQDKAPKQKNVLTIDSLYEKNIAFLDTPEGKTTVQSMYNMNNEKLPIGISGSVKFSMTESQANTALNDMCRANPNLLQILNDPIQGAAERNKAIQMLTQQTIPLMLPVGYLIDKKPGDTVMYQGKINITDSAGLKIPEKEGNKAKDNLLCSPQENDPSFIKSAHVAFVVTEQFCKQANALMRESEQELEQHEIVTSDAQKRADDFRAENNIVEERTPRQHRGNNFGFTNGWNGGKSLMDTEKRDSSSRPK